MAVTNIKAPRKTTKKRTSKSLDLPYIGYLPDWSTVEKWESENFAVALSDALRHYGYFNGVKDLRPAVITWMANNGYNTAEVKAYKSSLEWRTPMTACSLAAAYAAGMPEYPRGTEYIKEAIAKAIAANALDGVEIAEIAQDAKDKERSKKTKAPTIQDRINDKVNLHILYFEEAYEDGIIERKEKHSAPDVMTYLKTEEVPPSMVTRIAAHFQEQHNEIYMSQGKNADEQLAEAYNHLTKADVKRFTDFYTALLADLEMYKAEKKVLAAPRKRKPQSKTKVVANLKYMKKHNVLKLVSVNPETIIDTKTLWTYNTKTRKLGVYHAAEYDTLGVKGTTITGFDINTSVSKTLRKPAQQLADFKKAGKVKLRTFMEDIKSVDIKLTGRVNVDTIILMAVT